MKPVKRIEIIIDSLDIRMVLQELEDIGISSYSVIRDVIGSGDRGARSGDLLNDAMKNSYILIACDEEQAEKITEALRPKLKRYGGMCLVSDAQWVQH
ncbi:MAG: P-II family nitrogen regulator [Halieaceae bacterium]|jgi:nitrogen regulatory protein PII|nr:P-II family nitrogen regulator [Halieaceae bacterium]